MRDGAIENGKYMAVVRTAGDGENGLYSTNALRFETAEAARDYASALSMRWTAVTSYTVIPSDTKTDHGYHYSRETIERETIGSIVDY